MNLVNQLNNINITQSAIIYVRCSTKIQNNPYMNGMSHDVQINACNTYCANNSLNVISTVSEICSARYGENQKMLLETINNYENINLVVYDITRFSRSIPDGTSFINDCINRNITIHYIKENVKVSNQREMCLIIPYLMASQNESDNISNRVKESIKFRKELGSHFGKPKFGYAKILENNIFKLIRNGKEQLIIQFIFKLKYGGYMPHIKLLFNQIKETQNQNIIGINNNIIYCLFGEYTSSNIVTILNENNILIKNKPWLVNNIKTILVNNSEIINDKIEKTNNFILELYKIPYTTNLNMLIDRIYQQFFIINGYSLTLDTRLIYEINNKDKIISFLNSFHVNFRIWDYNCLIDYEEFCYDYRNNHIDDNELIV